jgi:HemY protein
VKLFFTLVAAVLIGLLAVWYLPLLEGSVLIRTGGVAVEMKVLVLVLLVLGSVALLHGLVWLWNLPGNVVRGHLQRRAQAQLELGMLALSEGDWARAEKALRLSAKRSDNSAAHYLAAARAAQGAGHDQRIEGYLEKANETARAQHPVAVTRAQLLLAAGDPEAALELLEGIRKPRETRPKVLELLARSYERLERWQDLAGLVPELVKHHLIDADHGQRIRLTATRDRLDRAADMGELQRLWNGLSKSERQDSAMLAEYAENAVKLGSGASVEKEVRLSLAKAWSSRLVMIYGQLDGADAAARLKSAERWLGDHPDDAVLHLTLARLCVEVQLWGKARDHFQTSINLQPMPEAYQELAELLDRLVIRCPQPGVAVHDGQVLAVAASQDHSKRLEAGDHGHHHHILSLQVVSLQDRLDLHLCAGVDANQIGHRQGVADDLLPDVFEWRVIARQQFHVRPAEAGLHGQFLALCRIGWQNCSHQSWTVVRQPGELLIQRRTQDVLRHLIGEYQVEPVHRIDQEHRSCLPAHVHSEAQGRDLQRGDHHQIEQHAALALAVHHSGQ